MFFSVFVVDLIYMKKILVIIIVLLVGGGIYFYLRYPDSPLIPYKPQGSTVQNVTNQNGLGNPVKQVDQANDATRRFTIQDLDSALKIYYSKNGQSPKTLDDLVTEKLIKSIKLDKVTNQPPQYFAQDPTYGCRVELELSDGTIAKGYCK